MMKSLSMVLVALSFTLAPVAHAAETTTKTETVKTVETTTDTKADAKASTKAVGSKIDHESCEHCKKDHKHGKDCACKEKKDCKCAKKDCDSGECMKKGSKKYCKHCAEHKDHAADEKKAE